MRDLIRKRIADMRVSLKEASLAIGKNHAYLQQYLERGIPAELNERTRIKLAGYLNIPERDLRPSGPELSTAGNTEPVETFAEPSQVPKQDERGSKEIRPMMMGQRLLFVLKLLQSLTPEEAQTVIGSYVHELKDAIPVNPQKRA